MGSLGSLNLRNPCSATTGPWLVTGSLAAVQWAPFAQPGGLRRSLGGGPRTSEGKQEQQREEQQKHKQQQQQNRQLALLIGGPTTGIASVALRR
mmetsp:Transcript_5838/g.16169  ORF Transcript_5838/g.16169 Transcript_5838/m.16169 type:complete len:94 (+) Transcript_5838:1-282(+)